MARRCTAAMTSSGLTFLECPTLEGPVENLLVVRCTRSAQRSVAVLASRAARGQLARCSPGSGGRVRLRAGSVPTLGATPIWEGSLIGGLDGELAVGGDAPCCSSAGMTLPESSYCSGGPPG